MAAFSAPQRDAIELKLELMRRKNPDTEAFFKAHPHEPFFVKNLENVQGDERDVILISVGYGRTAEGKLSMNFGPLNQDGGERRLNVLITRARRACEVFANFTAEDLDLSRTDARGVAALKTFLTYAKDGDTRAVEAEARNARPPAFEEAVQGALEAEGFAVDLKVGCAGFRIDLALRDPERPERHVLGILCDGASYDAARSARDRDRLRGEVLEGLGWRLHRLWSTDWQRDPGGELERIRKAFDKALKVWKKRDRKAAEAEPVEPETVGDEENPVVRRSDESRQDGEAFEAEPYVQAAPTIILGDQQLPDCPPAQIAGYLVDVVRIEGPIHRDEASKRIMSAAGLKSAGKKIRTALDAGTDFAVEHGHVAARGDFLWPADLDTPPVRDRTGLKGNLRKVPYLPPEEIETALIEVIRSALTISPEEAASSAFELMGFKRMTAPHKEAAAAATALMIERGLLEVRNGFLAIGSGEPAEDEVTPDGSQTIPKEVTDEAGETGVEKTGPSRSRRRKGELGRRFRGRSFRGEFLFGGRIPFNAGSYIGRGAFPGGESFFGGRSFFDGESFIRGEAVFLSVTDRKSSRSFSSTAS